MRRGFAVARVAVLPLAGFLRPLPGAAPAAFGGPVRPAGPSRARPRPALVPRPGSAALIPSAVRGAPSPSGCRGAAAPAIVPRRGRLFSRCAAARGPLPPSAARRGPLRRPPLGQPRPPVWVAVSVLCGLPRGGSVALVLSAAALRPSRLRGPLRPAARARYARPPPGLFVGRAPRLRGPAGRPGAPTPARLLSRAGPLRFF